MKDFTQIFTLGRKAKAAVVAVAFALSMPIGAEAQEMFGDTIFFEDFGTGCGTYATFEAAGLGNMSTISSLYSSYTGSSKFDGGNYIITDNTKRVEDMNSGNSYLVDTLGDHTHMVDRRQTKTNTCSGTGTPATNGRYLLINGSKEAGSVFKRRINELCKNSQFQFSCWAARAHATGHADGWNDCKFQFEFWAEDPGDAIIVSGDGTSLVPGAKNAVYKTAADKSAGTESQVLLLGKTDVFKLKEFSNNLTCHRTDNVQFTTSTNEYKVYKQPSRALYVYVDGAGIYHETTPSATPLTSSTTFAEGGAILESSTQVQPVYARSKKDGKVSDPVYTNGSQYVDYNGSKYYGCNYTGVDGADIEHTSSQKSVSGYYQLQIQVKDAGGNKYPLYLYTHTDGETEYLIKDGVTYYSLTLGSSFQAYTPVWVLDAGAGDEIAAVATVVPSTNQAEIYSDIPTYEQEVDFACEDIQGRWEELKASFFLEGQDYVYLVLRNAVGNNTANDFAIDDIAFIPHNEFNLAVATGSNAINTACHDGMVTIEASFNVEPSKRAVVREYISQFGFFFEGYNATSMTWERLGNGMPMQVQDLDQKLELTLPLNEYTLYQEFRLASSYTVEGFAGKCITFATPNSPAMAIPDVPQFKILGNDICVETENATDGSTAKFVIVNTSKRASGSPNGWKVRIKQPDGSYKWLVPDVCATP
jgi:hypothetical protein